MNAQLPTRPDDQPTMKISNYRHKKILEMLYQRQSISADELATEFGVSKMTIRRDLDTLAGENLLERTRGGAVLASGLRLEELFDQKDHVSKREKSLIGRYAASLVSEHETVFVNAGSTTLEVIRHLRGKKVRIVTNNAACLGLDLDPEQEIILLGGDYRSVTHHVRNATGVVDIRSRPMWDEWEADVRIRFDADQFSLTDITNLLSRVGAQVGIGEGRPDSKSSAGMGWGMFRLSDAQDEARRAS